MKPVPTKEVDYLEEDRPVRGQNFVCLSFISPEDVLANKDTFFFGEYLRQFASEIKLVFENLKEKYPADTELIDGIKSFNGHLFDGAELQDHFGSFVRNHHAALEKNFLEKHPFKTTVRGIKVRGSYDTLEEAKIRCQVLKKMGDKFDIYVAQVGCWCPWSPMAEDLENMEYAETQLNTLVKGYKDNQALKEAVFQERKQQAVARGNKKAKADDKRNEASTSSGTPEDPSAVVEELSPQGPSEVLQELADKDPWTEQKQDVV